MKMQLTMLSAALLLATPLAFGDAAELYTSKCKSCHGADGNSQLPDYPKLAGQHRDYLEKALRDYKSGARKNPIMAGFAAALTKDDIANLAAWFSAQPASVKSRY